MVCTILIARAKTQLEANHRWEGIISEKMVPTRRGDFDAGTRRIVKEGFAVYESWSR